VYKLENHKEKILVVDDEISIRRILETRLSMIGYLVITAGDGEEALEIYKREMPNLIILDIMMPKINGIDVMKKLREDEKTANIPIILLTALVQEINKIKKMMKPYDSYLIKSEIMPAQVIEEIEKEIEAAKAKKEAENQARK
jgi:OmpR family response regulator RpaB